MEQKLGFYDKTVKAESSGPAGRMGADEQQRRKIDLLSQDKEYLTK